MKKMYYVLLIGASLIAVDIETAWADLKSPTREGFTLVNEKIELSPALKELITVEQKTVEQKVEWVKGKKKRKGLSRRGTRGKSSRSTPAKKVITREYTYNKKHPLFKAFFPDGLSGKKLHTKVVEFSKLSGPEQLQMLMRIQREDTVMGERVKQLKQSLDKRDKKVQALQRKEASLSAANTSQAKILGKNAIQIEELKKEVRDLKEQVSKLQEKEAILSAANSRFSDEAGALKQIVQELKEGKQKSSREIARLKEQEKILVAANKGFGERVGKLEEQEKILMKANKGLDDKVYELEFGPKYGGDYQKLMNTCKDAGFKALKRMKEKICGAYEYVGAEATGIGDQARGIGSTIFDNSLQFAAGIGKSVSQPLYFFQDPAPQSEATETAGR